MRHLISRLSQSALARRVVTGLGLHHAGNWWLRRFPRVSRLPGSGVVYRASRLESIPLAVEMFERNSLYDAGLLPANFTHFADLGCNVGYFTCWLAHLAQGRELSGIMIDANPGAVAESDWHARSNRWSHVYALHGIVGEGDDGTAKDFFLYESNICSMTQLPDVEAMGLMGKWTRISVPCLRLEESWRQRFGDARCHLLKIDIEGSELDFLKKERSFLARVDCMLIEWHKWRVKLDDVKAFLAKEGFELVKVLEENEQMGTAFFRKMAAT